MGNSPTDDLPEPPRYRVIGRYPPMRRGADGLYAEERRFAQQYLIDLSPEGAATRAGLVAEAGRELLRQANVQDQIARERASRSRRTQLYADDVLARWWMLATADPREIVSIRRNACRYCHGFDHRYQFTKNELERAQSVHRREMMKLPDSQRVPFDDHGGDGYDPRKKPVEDCPECFGDGELVIYVADSDTYSPAAVALFNGVKVSRDGSIEVKLRDRTEALNKVAGFLGLLVQRHAVMTIDPARLTNEQLEEFIKQFQDLVGQNRASGADAPTIRDNAVRIHQAGTRIERAGEDDSDDDEIRSE